ncbi:MAG: asparagine synthase [Cenarchaeum symbiont of Oopsacas minuta]|nr:asparagine synthase [Cenarchaeum symbiont of Oopsacas minuta]
MVCFWKEFKVCTRPIQYMISAQQLAHIIQNAVSKSDFDCIAVSGGLDSTILAHLISHKNPPALAVAASDFASPDLPFCLQAAKHCNLKLVMLRPSVTELVNAAKESVGILENFNNIEVRNAAVMYLLLVKAKEFGMKNIMTGDGADELFAGYKFMERLDLERLQSELERVWGVMHFTSQIIAKKFGMSIVSPFLDESVVKTAKSINAEYKVRDKDGKMYGKWILRKAFESSIPHSIAWRQKAAMQDGAGTVGLVAHFDKVISDDDFIVQTDRIRKDDGVTLQSKESLYYYKIYRERHKPPFGGECPQCNGHVMKNSKFCRMCGAYPI